MLLSLLIIACWSSSILAARTNEFCFGGCQQALRAVRFTDTDAKSRIALCQSDLGISSFYLCNKVHCSEEAIQNGLPGLNETCMRFTNTYLPPFSIIANYTEDDIALLRQLQPEEAARTVTTALGEVVVPSRRLFHLAFDTLATAYFESETHLLYGYAMYYFWAVVISIGLSTHLVTLIKSIQRQDLDWQPLLDRDDPASEEVAVKRNSNTLGIPHALLKRYIIVPATFGYRCSQNIKWCTIPPRIQSLTISAFIILNIVLCSISYRVFQDNMYWPEVSTQLYRYISDRTGIISLANLPLIWLFGTRNNALLWLTGWDFATYNHFHRWVARVSTVEAVVHSILYTVMVMDRGGWRLYKIYWHKRYFFYGEIATIFMVAVCVFSVYGLRRRFYEIFLQIHIILSIFILIGMWYHVEIFNGEYNGYIWPCVFVWMFDRIFRLCRVLSFNPKFWNTIAVNTYDPDSNIIRLVVPHSTSFVQPRPGMYYYIYVLSDRRPWENHPFTLAHSTGEQTDSCKSSSMSLGTITPPQREVSSPTPGNRSGARHTTSREIETLLTSSAKDTPPSMTFLIRPYDGFTERLKQSAIGGPVKLRVLIEGPYGHTQPLHKFDNVLFIAGGTGIAMPLSYMEKLIHDDANVTSVRIVWAVREDEFLADVISTDFKTTLDNEKASLAAYVTRATDIQKDQELQTRSKGIHVYQGRPNVYNEVEESARNSRRGSLAVIACGPGQMADDARRSVVNVLGKGWGHVEYFEESFNW